MYIIFKQVSLLNTYAVSFFINEFYNVDKAFLNGPYIRIRPATPDGSFDEILSLSYQNIRRRKEKSAV